MFKKNYGSINGLLLGIISIFGAFLIEGGSFKTLFLLPAMIIVFGGTFSAVIIGYGFQRFKKIFFLIHLAYFPKKYNLKKVIDLFFDIAIIIRRDGILAVEKEINKFDHYFSRKLMRYMLDGANEAELENLAQYEIKAMQERHFLNMSMFAKMGSYAPTMGIIGTVMGLIMTLANAGADPNTLIRNIASAFIATLWGVFSANIMWLPIGDKLKQCHIEEKNLMEVVTEGVLALRSGEVPSLIKTRLASSLPQKEQEELIVI
ncbi:MAG: MotA/TolQ/ExbB proton channel family protein [Ignavibacteriales bacterium]|nr:MotA/TolQ/ExbB proton channel family protein [Ignavibacteriales bacterium]